MSTTATTTCMAAAPPLLQHVYNNGPVVTMALPPQNVNVNDHRPYGD